MRIQILCTVGPASLSPVVIAQMDEAGVDLFRVNLSHTPLDELEHTLDLLEEASSTPVCLDLEGAQVRCGQMRPGVVLRRGERVRLTAADVEGTDRQITLRPAVTFAALEPGSRIWIDFDGAELQVTAAGTGHAEAVVVSDGRVRSNKGVLVDPAPELPTLTGKDREAIALGTRRGLRHVALSFARSAEDVELVRSLVPSDTRVISKIESAAGVRNMDSIIDRSDAVLIDRGDLSKEVALEHVPFYQKAIVRRANRWSRQVYVATNLLESMVTNRTPTIAEANDIANTLLDGVHGLVMSAETAIGHDPVGIVRMVARMVRAFEGSNFATLLERDQPLTAAS
ncbi:MAG TPA: pyruvate kinase [Actinomycetes bacterium]